MVEKKFSEELKTVFDYIQNTLLKEYDCDKIPTEYFVLSVLQNEGSVGYNVLSKIMLHDTIEKARLHFVEWLSMNAKKIGTIKQYDEIFDKSINDAGVLADKYKSNTINSGHVLYTIVINNSEVNNYFKTFGVTINQINTQVVEETKSIIQSEKQKREKTNNFIKPQRHIKKEAKKKGFSNQAYDVPIKIDGECARITQNLNEMALNGEIDTVYGNESIYEEIFNVLSKRNKNNVVIVGKSGVGKTETVRNLANLIVSGDVPKAFRNKLLLEVDFNSLFYGTQMRGAFETKMKSINMELKLASNYIFFIDSLGNVLNSNFTQNEVEEFIETIMKNKNVMLICTCSDKAYAKEIGDYPSWERYFEKIELEEPDEEKCVEILRQHAEKLAVFHDVIYEDDVFETCIKCSKRYITERNLPDSAIDILDKAGAKKSLIDEENEEIQHYKNLINQIKFEIEDAKQNNIEKRNELLKREIELRTSLDMAIKQYNLSKDRQIITINDIKECISEKTNVPITELSVDDKDKLKNLNERIKNIVIGQDEAVDIVCKAIKRQRVGISNPNKPVVFLMAGSTGVGKSYLAKVIAKEVFGDEKKLVRLDMAEYADKTSLTKLIGSGSGYIGYNDGGVLTEAIKKNKHCVLLLDEIEKADEEVHNAFLSMFDEGRMTDNKGVTVDFKNVIVIMTSNIGAKEADERGNGIGFVTNSDNLKKEIIEKELKRKFKPEFINRIDNIIYFNKLTDDNIRYIIKLEINKIRERLQSIGYDIQENIEYTNLFNIIYNNVITKKNMGARPIIRELQTLVEDKITDYIIEGNIKDGHVFTSEELLSK